MPFEALDSVPFTVGATIRDNNNKRSTVAINLPSSLNAVELSTWTTALGAALENLSDGYVERVWQTIVYGQTGTDLRNPTSEVERKLIIPLAGAGNVRGQVSIPSPIFSLESDGSDEVSPLQPVYAALLTLLLNGTPGAANGAVNINGLQFTRVNGGGFISHYNRKRSKR